MNIKQGINNVMAWVKKRPILAAAIVFTTVVAVWYLTRPRGSTTSSAAVGGGVPYILPNQQDSGAGLQAQAMEMQASVARMMAEKESEVLLAQIEAARSVEMERLSVERGLSTMALSAQTSMYDKQFALAEKALEAQYNPKTYATMEIAELYASVGRTPTSTDITYWAGQYAGNPGTTTVLRNELEKDQVVLSNIGVTKNEANTIAALYAAQGRTPTQADYAYWGNYAGDMEAALSYQLQVDGRKNLVGA